MFSHILSSTGVFEGTPRLCTKPNIDRELWSYVVHQLVWNFPYVVNRYRKASTYSVPEQGLRWLHLASKQPCTLTCDSAYSSSGFDCVSIWQKINIWNLINASEHTLPWMSLNVTSFKTSILLRHTDDDQGMSCHFLCANLHWDSAWDSTELSVWTLVSPSTRGVSPLPPPPVTIRFPSDFRYVFIGTQ